MTPELSTIGPVSEDSPCCKAPGQAYSSGVLRRGIILVLAAVAGVLLLASAAGAGGGQVEVVVPSGGAQGCTGFLGEALSGATMRCIPFACGDYPGKYQPDAAAADGSVVFSEQYALGELTTIAALTELVHPNGNAIALDTPPGFDWDVAPSGSKVAFLRLGDSTNPTTIYVVNADGSGLRLVAPWNGAYLSPRSPPTAARSPTGAAPGLPVIRFTLPRPGVAPCPTAATAGAA